MQIKINNKFCDVLDNLCIHRPCFHMHRNYGSFSQGRGYTSQHTEEIYHCNTRACYGCPDPIPQPNPESTRCCWFPNVNKVNKERKPPKQRCKTCKTWLTGFTLKEVRENKLPKLFHCEHKNPVKIYNNFFRCYECDGTFLSSPKKWETPTMFGSPEIQ